jgi:hypothetical protein
MYVWLILVAAWFFSLIFGNFTLLPTDSNLGAMFDIERHTGLALSRLEELRDESWFWTLGTILGTLSNEMSFTLLG